MTKTEWKVGQTVTINRGPNLTIERVTPTGRAVVNGRTFNPDGSERGATMSWEAITRLELLTSEIEEFRSARNHAIEVTSQLTKALLQAERWVRDQLALYRRTPSKENVGKGERLLQAIVSVMGDQA